MNTTTIRHPGIALLCDTQGIIIKVVRDALGLNTRRIAGMPLTRLLDRGSLKKALSFLVEVRTRGAAFDWEMNVPIGDEIVTLHFAGSAFDDHLMILGAESEDQVMQLYQELVQIGNEQANALRTAMKTATTAHQTHARKDGTLYDEISRLNNQLVDMQRELAKKNVELERLNEQKNRFLGMAAHDLRNPLHLIGGYSEFLIDEASDALTEEQSEMLAIIQSSSQFMRGLVDDLLDIATIESGRLRLDPRSVDLNELMAHNVALNRLLAAKKQIEIHLHAEPTPPVTVDPAKIEQVMNNLISNAIKFSHPNTTIDVRITKNDQRVLISVQDQGQGIPADEIDNVFNPFERTTVKSTAGEKSSGLGLAIVKKIVEEHQGMIRVESEVGQGTTFEISLPIHQQLEGDV